MPSSFLSLPSEIRGIIYKHLFSGECVSVRWGGHLRRHSNTQRQSLTSPPPLPNILSILLTCHTTYTEATPYLYSFLDVVFASDRIVCPDLGSNANGPPSSTTSSLQSWIYFPWYLTAVKTVLEQTPRLSSVRRVHYTGSDADVLRNLRTLFPHLLYFQFDLGWDHVGNDSTNFDRAVKHARRVGEWKAAVRDALRDRFTEGVLQAVAKMKKKGPEKRGFQVELRWRLGYRFVEFEGMVGLDEWILRVKDAENTGSNVYDIRLDPFEVEEKGKT